MDDDISYHNLLDTFNFVMRPQTIYRSYAVATWSADRSEYGQRSSHKTK